MPSVLRRLQVAPWAVAAAGFAMMFASGAIWGSFTLFLVAIEADTGWSKTTIARIAVVALFASFLCPFLNIFCRQIAVISLALFKKFFCCRDVQSRICRLKIWAFKV